MLYRLKIYINQRGIISGNLLLVLLICTIMSMVSLSTLNLMSSYFSGMSAGREELEAQSWAAIKADVVRLTGYEEIKNQSRTIIDGSENQWEDEVEVGPEKVISVYNKQKIITVNIYRTGESFSRFSLKVPLSTQGSIIRRGMILSWSGSITEIPFGWLLCDGTNGTPDLRDRFVVGAGRSYYIGAIGGEAFHQLTVSEMPRHNHSYYYYVPENPWDGIYSVENNQGSGAHRYRYNATTDYAGSSQSHENRPPYYALAYIMKL